MLIPEPFEHQKQTIAHLGANFRAFDASDPGTGKTRAALEAFRQRRKAGGGKALVLAPKSILQPAWGNDIDKFTPDLAYVVARAENRLDALGRPADVYITNHDAVRALAKQTPAALRKLFHGFDTLIIDESTAYKHASTGRSKAARKLASLFDYRECMSGSPNPNTILELWHQVFLLDDGARLGPSFYKFRNVVCEPVQTGPSANHLEWRDKPGIEDMVFDLIRDITIRHKFEDCVSIPENHTYDVTFELPAKLRKQYQEMLDDAVANLGNGKVVSAIHASAVNTKLLQIASGAVYTDDQNYEVLDTSRTDLILDLVEARPHSLVVFNWKHQRDLLLDGANKRGITVAVIDGDVSNAHLRTDIVQRFQDGEYQALLIHPQSAGHGLTLTRATSTIWASPTYNSEHWKQVFHRAYRTGQTEKTETIRVAARDTIDEHVYRRLGSKLTAMQLFLELAEAA